MPKDEGIELNWHGDEVWGKVNLAVAAKIGEACFLVLAESKRRMRDDPKTGIVYRKPFAKQATWQASAAGEAPAIVSGTLYQSMTTEVSAPTGTGDMEGRVGTNVEYARYLELGTNRMAARPFLAPALMLTAPLINALFAKNDVT